VGGSWKVDYLVGIVVTQSFQSASNKWSVKVYNGSLTTSAQVTLKAICIG
jgi:hypothetical protein